jgi:hypothetical protein
VKVYRFHHEGVVKASCCNSETLITYWMAESREEAEEAIAEHTPEDRKDHGNCPTCFADLLAEGDYEILNGGDA